VDDDPVVGRLLSVSLQREGWVVVPAERGEDALRLAADESPAAVLLDLGLPDMDGMKVLEQVRARQADLPVIVITAQNDIKLAVRAMRLGAADYLVKPIDAEELSLTLQRALERGALEREVRDLRKRAGPAATLAEQMGPGPEVAKLAEQVALVAPSNMAVLILGETGAGKELVAQAIHRESARRDKPMMAVDCGAIPDALLESELFGHEKGAFTGAERRRKGQFRSAQGSTIFLDEVGNLPMPLQPKLLRVLESGEVRAVGAEEAEAADVRVVAATNVQLTAKVRDGSFREDLYFRLAQFTIQLPALRERPGDIPHLAQRFMAEACVELRRPVIELTPDALEALAAHRWPGNVRELRNVVRQAVLESRNLAIHGDHIRYVMSKAPAAPATEAPAPNGDSLREIGDAAVEQAERAAIGAALRESKGNKSVAARALRTDYKTLHVKMQRYGIKPDSD
jgi:DNA-binding NtrC family response regulator